MFKIFIHFLENLIVIKFDRRNVVVVEKCSYRKICFGKFGVGKSVTENSVFENLLSEKSPRPEAHASLYKEKPHFTQYCCDV